MVRSRITPDDSSRQCYLQNLCETAPCDELSFFLLGDQKQVREISDKALRVIKEDRIFVSYYAESESEAADWMEKGLLWVQSHIISHFGASNNIGQEELERVFRCANETRFQWHSYLTDKLGLQVFPMSPDEMKEYAWKLFNSTSAPSQFPQLITYDHDGLRLEQWSETSPSTLLTADQVPQNDRAWIYHPNTQTYSAVLTFLDKPYAWENAETQMRYLFDLLGKTGIKHIEFVTQVWRGDSRLARINMEKLIRQSKNRGKEAATKGEVNVAAGQDLEESIEAQKSMIKGSVPFNTAVAIIVHAPDPDTLKKLCRVVQNNYQAPAVVSREKEVVWELWLQSLPITRSKLLVNAFSNRTLTYRNEEVLAFLPLFTTLSSAKQGVELIAQDSKIPVYLDVFQYEGRHVGFFASSRSGKSVAIGSVLTTALSQGIPVVAIDYPGSSGRSTFTDYTKYLDVIGDYFDVREHSFNIFDRINLSKIKKERERKIRWQLYTGFLKETLVAMVLGGKAASLDARLETEVKTVISFAVNAFFKNESILARYQRAEAGGVGSEAWQKSPTLKDFMALCNANIIRAELPEEFVMDEKTLNNTLYFVQLQLSYWLNSELGNAIGRPSTVKPDAMLMVFALTALKEDESLIFALIAFTAAYSRSLEYQRTLFFIDESPILLKFPAISKIVASLFANGSKSGIRVVLSAQAPNQIANNPSTAGDILQNMHYRMLGRIEETAIESCVNILGIQEEMVRRCTKFEPDKAKGRTQWLFFDGSRFSYVNYYAPPVQLATLVNNTDEADVRESLKEHYPDNVFMALYQFSELFREAHMKGMPIKEVYQALYPTIDVESKAA
ncbi:helicase HerA domain-containing protein [Crocosphaera subtropica]|nr:DUF87 domain-containing protein [Crocosphaera subtropica]